MHLMQHFRCFWPAKAKICPLPYNQGTFYEIPIFWMLLTPRGGLEHVMFERTNSFNTSRRLTVFLIIEFRRSDVRNNGPQFSPVRRLWPIFYLAHHLIGSEGNGCRRLRKRVASHSAYQKERCLGFVALEQAHLHEILAPWQIIAIRSRYKFLKINIVHEKTIFLLQPRGIYF